MKLLRFILTLIANLVIGAALLICCGLAFIFSGLSLMLENLGDAINGVSDDE